MLNKRWYETLLLTWKLSLSSVQICDKEWHYYVINVEFPAVTLFVDGVTYEPYLVTDDWPIHTSKIDTQLTVGACWQGQCARVCMCVHVCVSKNRLGSGSDASDLFFELFYPVFPITQKQCN